MVVSTGLIIAGIVGALLSAGVGAYSAYSQQQSVKDTNAINAQNIRDTNAQNLQIARENNAQQMDLAKNGISYRMQDYKNAGLNPVLAAGGASAPQATLSTAHQQAAQNQAPLLDLNGVSSAINSLSNFALTQELISQRHDSNIESREKIASERNDVLKDLYKRKAGYLSEPSTAIRHVGTAKQLTKVQSQKWDDALKELNKKYPYKY